MKKTLTILFLFAFLAVSATFPRVSPAPLPPELRANYSDNVPTVDGYLGATEWKDASRYEINLTGATDIETWVYIKHNDTHIHIGLLVREINDHTFDEFVLIFDEGDDGANGSGSRDYVLTSNQEDLKACFTPPQTVNNYNLSDGYYDGGFVAAYTEINFDARCVHETDHATIPSEIEYIEGFAFIDDHWEVEFSVPFVGHDGGSQDVSDLNCTTSDTVGLKLQYFRQPASNYYYPAGSLAEIATYANLMFLPPSTIESCDNGGVQKDTFALLETVYVSGAGFIPFRTYDIYVVDDVATWVNGSSIPARVPDTAINVTSGLTGNIPPTEVWNDPPSFGLYDVIVDVNGNGKYDEGIDVLDTDDIQVTAGFIVPEFALPLALLGFMMTTFLACWTAKTKIKSYRKPV